MNKRKQSKKDLRNLISETINKALGGLDLPRPNKKVKKIVENNSKKLASTFVELIKHEDKKQKKAEKLLQKAVATDDKKKKEKQKEKKNQNGKLVEPITI
jgi:hypothetical protein